MPDWSIKIIPAAPAVEGGAAQFIPDVAGGKPGEPAEFFKDDLVSWNNMTSERHHPWPADNNYRPLSEEAAKANFLSDVILPHRSSAAWVAAPSSATGTTIFYCCKLHPQEWGQIVIIG